MCLGEAVELEAMAPALPGGLDRILARGLQMPAPRAAIVCRDEFFDLDCQPRSSYNARDNDSSERNGGGGGTAQQSLGR
jgi:hypothetical protein